MRTDLLFAIRGQRMSVVARASGGDTAAYLREIGDVVRHLDPVVPVYDVTTLAERVGTSMSPTTGGATAPGDRRRDRVGPGMSAGAAGGLHAFAQRAAIDRLRSRGRSNGTVFLHNR